jgi:hypothetical protein
MAFRTYFSQLKIGMMTETPGLCKKFPIKPFPFNKPAGVADDLGLLPQSQRHPGLGPFFFLNDGRNRWWQISNSGEFADARSP